MRNTDAEQQPTRSYSTRRVCLCVCVFQRQIEQVKEEQIENRKGAFKDIHVFVC